MADILAEQYSSVFSIPAAQPPLISTDAAPINNIEISQADLINAIDEIKPTAAAGPDGIPAILLKKCKNALAEPLTTLWNKCMETSQIPPSLKEAIIPPIHKGGSKADPARVPARGRESGTRVERKAEHSEPKGYPANRPGAAEG